jgi:hypothetical protein
MATATTTRRLAAILAADVAGYSRLMGADEEGTHKRLRAHLASTIDLTVDISSVIHRREIPNKRIARATFICQTLLVRVSIPKDGQNF